MDYVRLIVGHPHGTIASDRVTAPYFAEKFEVYRQERDEN